MAKHDRRGFLGRLGAATWACLGIGLTQCRDSTDPVQALVRANDISLRAQWDRLEVGSDHPFRGALPNGDGLFIPMSTALFLQYGASAFTQPASRYFQRPALGQRLREASEALLRMQHEDGTIDLPTTNFHSTPDTAFVVEPLALTWKLLREQPGQEEVRENLKTFLLAAGDSLVRGGIHTPNHRWVVGMALAHLYENFGHPAYRDRAEQWLAEGIDVDADGHYAERSVGIYSPLTDRCLITVARLFDRPDLLRPVRRNLDSTLYLVHPDGTLATEGSRRQDQFQEVFAQAYYYPYAFMARRDGDPRYAGMAQHILRTAGIPRLRRYLAYFLLEPSLFPPPARRRPVPRQYVRHFRESGMVRVRRDRTDATLLAGNPVFFSLRKGTCALRAVRLATAFFGKGQFEADELEVRGNAFRLRQTLEGPYFQPFPVEEEEQVGDEPWNEERERRPKSEIQRLVTEIEVRETPRGFALTIEVSGTQGVPAVLELAFGERGGLSGLEALPGRPGWRLPEGRRASFQAGNDKLSFGPGRQAHTWTHLRGALPPLSDDSVFLTGYTPWRLALDFT